jgi:hypothetical protein
MKKFIISVLCVAVFFVGLGSLVQNVGAKFKSDERALELVRLARIAIGGEESITNVKSLSIVGKQTMTFDRNGTSTENIGDVEIALQLPNQLAKIMKFGRGSGNGANLQVIEENVNITVARDNNGKIITENIVGANSGKNPTVRIENAGSQEEKIIVKKADGTIEELKTIGAGGDFTTSDGNKIKIVRVTPDNANVVLNGNGNSPKIITKDIKLEGVPRQNELLRLTLSLLMTAPQGLDVAYTYGGEGNVDSTVCNIVNASFGGETFKIFLDKLSNLPVAMNYSGMMLPKTITTKSLPKGDEKDVRVIVKTSGEMQSADFQVKFSDYRSVNGVQLPYRWTTTSAGNPNETFDITNYEVNSPNIAEKFNKQPQLIKIMRVEGPKK